MIGKGLNWSNIWKNFERKFGRALNDETKEGIEFFVTCELPANKPTPKIDKDNLPFGVAEIVYESVKKIPTMPNLVRFDHPLSPLAISFGGIQVFMNELYPLHLKDGTTVWGCMVGANGSRILLLEDQKL